MQHVADERLAIVGCRPSTGAGADVEMAIHAAGVDVVDKGASCVLPPALARVVDDLRRGKRTVRPTMPRYASTGCSHPGFGGARLEPEMLQVMDGTAEYLRVAVAKENLVGDWLG